MLLIVLIPGALQPVLLGVVEDLPAEKDQVPLLGDLPQLLQQLLQLASEVRLEPAQDTEMSVVFFGNAAPDVVLQHKDGVEVGGDHLLPHLVVGQETSDFPVSECAAVELQ